MKRNFISLLTFVMISTNLSAQNEKSFTGYYRASGPTHLLIDEDHRFYIIAYSTFIQGTWCRENNTIKLEPHNPEHTFALYARYNPNIKEGYKIKFNDFYKKETFIGMDSTDMMQRVFNPNPNCFNNPYINHFAGKTTSISFVDAFADPESSPRKTYTYSAGKFNDFVAIYHDPSHYRREITLYIEQKVGQLNLKNENGQFENSKMDERLQQEIIEIRDMAKKEQHTNDLYCNPSYRPFDRSSMNFEMDYSFDGAKNAWVSKHNYEKDEEIYPERKEDAYHSIGIIYKYEKLTPTNIVLNKLKINEKSLFTAKCNDND